MKPICLKKIREYNDLLRGEFLLKNSPLSKSLKSSYVQLDIALNGSSYSLKKGYPLYYHSPSYTLSFTHPLSNLTIFSVLFLRHKFLYDVKNLQK